MELFLIVVLAIVLLIAWNSTRHSLDRMRVNLDRLQSEVDFLRSQLAALFRATTKQEEPKTSPAHPQVAASVPPQPPSDPRPTQAANTVPVPISPFTPPAPPKPVETVPPMPVNAQPVSTSTPALQPEPKPQPESITTRPAEWIPRPPTTQPLRPREAAQPKAPQPSAQPQPAAYLPEPQSPRARLSSLEETLGANWLGKIGVASLVIGIASFLAWKLQTWGPGGKVLCGFAVSALLLGGGVWLERKPTYRIFARGGIGGGWALAYFTTFAAYHLQAARVINSLPVDLVLMLLVAAGMVGHSLRYRSQAVTSLAFMLGFGTLLTSHIENPTQTVAFSLAASAILAIALVVVTTIRHWALLELCGLIAVYASHFVWLNEVLPQRHSDFAEFWPSTALILLYWLIFRLAYVIRAPLDKREENISSVSAILNSAGVLGLLKFQSAHPEWAFWALVVLGAFELSLAWWAKAKRRQAFVVLSTIAVVLLASSVPFRFHGVSWPLLWLIQAQVLASAGLRLGEPIFRRLGLLVGIVTGAVLALHDVMPLAIERLIASNTGHHWSLTAGLALAAILYWTHSEIYPRRWPEIATNDLESVALRVSSWLGLGAAATSLWVVLPDQWLPIGWLALFLVLVSAGHRFRAINPLLEGDILALASVGVLAFHHLLPLIAQRIEASDPSHHPAETALFTLAAMALWVRAELFPRILFKLHAQPGWDPAAWECVILPITSCIGTATATAAIWIGLPSHWVPVGWLLLVLALGFAADSLTGATLALQADTLAVASILDLTVWDLAYTDWNHRLPLLISLALLYCGMRRKTSPGSHNYAAAAYSWASAALLPFIAWNLLAHHHAWIAPVLTLVCLALFEIGRLARKSFLRWQGYALIAIAYAIYISGDLPLAVFQFPNPPLNRDFTLVGSCLFAVLILLAAGYWLLERTRTCERTTRTEHVVGLVANSAGIFCLVVWTGIRFPFYISGGDVWISSLWAAMATTLLALAWLIRRRIFLVQAIALAIAAVLRGLLFDLIGYTHGDFWHSPLYHLSITAFILIAALPFAFKLRGATFWDSSSLQPIEPVARALHAPEQWFFFAPFAMMVIALAVKLTSGHITIAWSLLGLGTFLFALIVRERSFRLAGLGLLLVSISKIVLMDIWKLSTPDRFTTLIILGAALMAVSFLYTRFSSTIRKYL